MGGRAAEAKRLIAKGAPVDWQYGDGSAPLHMASNNGRTEIVMLLLENKCNLNVTDNDGNTPFMYAAWNNKMDTVRALVEAGCDITIRGFHNKTAAEKAKKRGNHAVAEYLTTGNEAGGSRSDERGRKKPRKNPAPRRLSAKQADKLGYVSVAALRERVPKQRYDAALAAGPHALTLP